jgi:hypothetical protein
VWQFAINGLLWGEMSIERDWRLGIVPAHDFELRVPEHSLIVQFSRNEIADNHPRRKDVTGGGKEHA